MHKDTVFNIFLRCSLKDTNCDAKIIIGNIFFSVLIEAANQWLTTNNSFTVWKCETVERKVTAGPMGQIIIEMDNMIFSESLFGFNVYIRGLR